MQPHYYLMKCKKILRLEADTAFRSLPVEVRARLLDHSEVESLDQNQANWRVVIFRDEIMEYDEYVEWLSTPEAMMEEEMELELIAN
jgi:hypothetical protein